MRPLLPKMPDKSILAIKALCVCPIGAVKDSMNRILLLRRHKMNMVRHQTPGENRQVKLSTEVTEQFQELQPVRFVAEYFITPCASLRDMEWHPRHNNARGS